MRFKAGLRSLLLALFTSALFIDGAHAHSNAKGPLNYLSTVENATIHTSSHQINANSNFDLTLSIHGGSQRIRLRLEPNTDILHHSAQVVFVNAEGQETQTESIARAHHRVFKGTSWVLLDGEASHWTQAGWARIVVHKDGIAPIFEGAFTLGHDGHHIQTRTRYHETKHPQEPWLEATADDYMVVLRDSDFTNNVASDFLEVRDVAEQEEVCNAGGNKPLSYHRRRKLMYPEIVKRSYGRWGDLSPRSLFSKRQIDQTGSGNAGSVNLANTIGSTAGCPAARRVALIGVAADCNYVSSFGSTGAAQQNIINQINTASGLYETSFNITIGLQNLTLAETTCPGTAPSSLPWNLPCSSNTTILNRLEIFSGWRGSRPDDNAYWTLMTDCQFDSGEVGLAWLGELCVATSTNSSGENFSGTNIVSRTSTEWQVFAHETGHTFGAVHDCTSQTCSDGTTVVGQGCCPRSSTTCDAGGQFIMNPATGAGISAFSPCTIGNICGGLAHNINSTCLDVNSHLTTITGQVCGNGIVEEGEDCDCGGTQGCQGDSCCNPTTCKFTAGSVCDDSIEECCSGCQFARNGTVCRASTGPCDIAETCSGASGTCPPDSYLQNGVSCGNSSGLTCASGQCTSRDAQCVVIMGSYAHGNNTAACSFSDGCTIACTNPSLQQGTCYSFNSFYLDGTPCNNGGMCLNGNCQGGSVLGSNQTLVIAIASVVGGLIVLGILWCLVWRFCCPTWFSGTTSRFRRGKQYPSPPQSRPDMAQMGGFGNYSNGGGVAMPRPTVRYA